MQSVKVAWVGKTFALARCSDSQGKKPRGRRTKEERKELVQSFVNKYQNSNNGAFPSLNLTHKEVGGSYYIVREIVREIIQENKVLAPGNPTSKVLNLDDCVEEHPQEYLVPESASHLSLAINGQAYEETHKEAFYFSAELQEMKEDIHGTSSYESFDENHETNKNILEKVFGVPNEVVTLEHAGGTFVGSKHQDEEEMYNVQQHGSSEYEGGCTFKHPVEVSQTTSSNPTLNKILSANTEINLEGEGAHRIDCLSLQHAVLDMTATVISKATVTESADTSHVSEELGVHFDSFQPIEKFLLSSKSSLSTSMDQEIQGRHPIGSSQAEGVELNEDKILQPGSVEPHFISSTFNSSLSISPGIALSDTSCLSSSERTESNVESLTLPSESYMKHDGVVQDKDSGEVEPEPLARTELKHYLSSRETGRSSLLKGVTSASVKDSHKKQDMPETNPVWSAIKGFIDAFVKFWMDD